VRDQSLGPALLAEAIGTFVLVFAGCGAIAVGSVYGDIPAPVVAAAFGLAILVMVYALGHVSGAHFNPAVTAAFAVSGHVPRARVLPYWGAQVAGAVVAALFLRASLGDGADLGVTQPAGSSGHAFAWEVALTAMLMLVITAVATDARAVRQAAAIAIGGAVALGALVGGPVSGASMNPARSLGPALVTGELGDLWIYLAAPVVGATAAAIAYDRSLRRSGVAGPARSTSR
jgi:MIP family channel proteins